MNPTPGERQQRVVALLEDAVLTEVTMVNGVNDLGLSEQQMETLSLSVVSGVLQAFVVDWSPGWVKAGDPHIWSEGDEHVARCPGCLLDSPAQHSEQTALEWIRAHEATH